MPARSFVHRRFSELALIGLCMLALPAHAVILPGDNPGSLTHDGKLRVYSVLAPTGYDGLSPYPLVVDLHGWGSSKEEQQALSGWSVLSETEGFLVAYPDGLANSWNGGTCCGEAVANNEDDVGFIRAMVLAIQAEANVDASRIYVTGLSNGGALDSFLEWRAKNSCGPEPLDDYRALGGSYCQLDASCAGGTAGLVALLAGTGVAWQLRGPTSGRG